MRPRIVNPFIEGVHDEADVWEGTIERCVAISAEATLTTCVAECPTHASALRDAYKNARRANDRTRE